MREHNEEQSQEDPEVATALVEGIIYSAKTYRIGIVVGQTIGGIACLCGMLLILLGFSGKVEWVVDASGFSSRLANASPGVIFAVIGLVILWRYKPVIEDDFSVRPGAKKSSLLRGFQEMGSILKIDGSSVRSGVHYKGKK